MEVYTVKEVAEILRISQKTVRRLIREGEIPMTTVGALWRIPKDQLQAYIAKGNQWTGQTNGTSGSTSETPGHG
jgi:excisionase family DNA binding protein